MTKIWIVYGISFDNLTPCGLEILYDTDQYGIIDQDNGALLARQPANEPCRSAVSEDTKKTQEIQNKFQINKFKIGSILQMLQRDLKQFAYTFCELFFWPSLIFSLSKYL